MAHLAITLFSGFQAELDGEPLKAFRTDKNRALLAYLAVESRRPHRREVLAALLWPDSSEVQARNSLRQALFQLNHLLRKGPQTQPHLLINREQVGFNLASDQWVDVLEFSRRLSACQAHHPQGLSLCVHSLKSLQRAIELYQGDLMSGLNLAACSRFTDWQVITQEACHRQALGALSLLGDYFEANLDYEQLIACTYRKIELEPWRESAYRRQMWALAKIGRRAEALRQYETLCEVLRRELGILPMDETRRLYEQIQDGRHKPLRPLKEAPRESQVSWISPPQRAGAAPFVGREVELAQLQSSLREALAGRGRMAFVSGEAGSGKSTLLGEFARRAKRKYGELVVAAGGCNAYRGRGDTYQPFREVLKTLVGISETVVGGEPISAESGGCQYAVWSAILETLLALSPGLIGVLLPAGGLLQQARQTEHLDEATLARLETLAAQPDSIWPQAAVLDYQMVSSDAELPYPAPADLFDQFARLLLAISHRFPLLILLDDLQWLDTASASLLFHLGRHLTGGRILMLGAYRPEDVASSPGQRRHPLAPVLNEFRRGWGEIVIDLSRADEQAFVEAYLDREPNRFDQEFRKTLTRHTNGNALFTVELLRAMRVRGEVVQDGSGCWIVGSGVDWDRLPARVEAVIMQRLGRLDGECLSLLEAASVQGEVFNPGALTQVLGVTEGDIITQLSGPLCRQHLLVSALCQGKGDGRQARYKFRSLLIQKYLYQSLDEVERARLHRATAQALGENDTIRV